MTPEHARAGQPTLFDPSPAHVVPPSADTPDVIFSHGLGVDSTAILLRWLHEPPTRDFPLDALLVVTAHTGSEWPDTIALAERHVLPLLAEHRIRYVQVARAGASQKDGIVVLSDTRAPDRLITSGGYRLADDLLRAGTVPQSSGDRRHSVNFKGVPLDKLIARETSGRAYRHVLGFEAGESDRAARDRRHGPASRIPVYPLIEWGWTRDDCTRYIRARLGVDWPKSACTFCPFALTAGARLATLARFAAHPAEAVLPLLMEHAAVAMNPRQGLIAGRRLADLMRRAPGTGTALELFSAVLDDADWSVYEVRRARLPRAGSGPAVTRHVSIHATSTREGARKALDELAAWLGILVEDSDGHPRAWLRRPGPALPAAEWFYVIAPAVVAAKTGPGFDAAWTTALAAPVQPDLCQQGEGWAA